MVKTNSDTIKCIISGGDIAPEKVSAKELAEFIIALEKTLALTVAKHSGIKEEEDFFISLVGISKGSLNLQLASNHPYQANQAVKFLGDAFNKKIYNGFSRAITDELKPIRAFLDKHHSEARFCFDTEGTTTLLLTPGFQLPDTKDFQIEGETTLCGELFRVGGIDPKAALRIAPNEDVFCDISEELAHKLASSLYKRVSLTGVATWDIDTYKILAFEVEDFEELEDLPIDEVMSNAGDILRDTYKSIDPDKYVRKLRSDEEW